jgi:hypothetical protein
MKFYEGLHFHKTLSSPLNYSRETRHCHLARKFEEFLMKLKLACQEFFFAICRVLSWNFFANWHAIWLDILFHGLVYSSFKYFDDMKADVATKFRDPFKSLTANFWPNFTRALNRQLLNWQLFFFIKIFVFSSIYVALYFQLITHNCHFH